MKPSLGPFNRPASLNLCRPLLLALLCSVVTAGCGTSEYDALYNRRLRELSDQAPFENKLISAQTFPDTRVSIRLPKTPAPFVAHVEGEKDIDPLRVQPPFIQLPGLRAGCEALVKLPAEANELPIYCYLAAVEAKEAKATLEKIVAVEKQFKKDSESETKELNDASGAPVTWKVLTINAKQPFEYLEPSSGVRVKKDLPGTFQLWYRETPDYLVMVGFRLPTTLESVFDLKTVGELSARTVKIEPAEAAAP